MRFIITNFAYGTGPYLRTTELALAVSREFEVAGVERLGVVVPWVYGKKQKRIMFEEFGGHETAHPGEILLDPRLGSLLGQVFYTGERAYEAALRRWVEEGSAVSREAHNYLAGTLSVEDLSGRKSQIHRQDIALELARAPRISYSVAPVYSVTFGHISEILEHVLEEPTEAIGVDRTLVRQAIPLAQSLEKAAIFHALAEPGTFSYLPDRQPRYATEIAIPPTITPPQVNPVRNSVLIGANHDPVAEGIYVTITGIPGLERLYAEAKNLGLRLYSNDPIAVPGSERLLPHMVSNPAIKFQFARSGWGSIWLSQLSGTPFVTPAFDPADDPEIYFNNRCIEELGLGIIYHGQPLREILAKAEELRPGIVALNGKLLERFGTFDGNEYAARRIVELHRRLQG